MKEMQLHDIGVLQNLGWTSHYPFYDASIHNGLVVEIIDLLPPGSGDYDYSVKLPFNGPHLDDNYLDDILNIHKHEIRPITDPDATQSIDEQETIEA